MERAEAEVLSEERRRAVQVEEASNRVASELAEKQAEVRARAESAEAG